MLLLNFLPLIITILLRGGSQDEGALEAWSCVLISKNLFFTALRCTVLYCTDLHCTALYYTAFYFPVLNLTLLQRFTALHCVAPNCESRCRGTKLASWFILKLLLQCNCCSAGHVCIAQITLFWASLRQLYRDSEQTCSTRNSIVVCTADREAQTTGHRAAVH